MIAALVKSMFVCACQNIQVLFGISAQRKTVQMKRHQVNEVKNEFNWFLIDAAALSLEQVGNSDGPRRN